MGQAFLSVRFAYRFDRQECLPHGAGALTLRTAHLSLPVFRPPSRRLIIDENPRISSQANASRSRRRRAARRCRPHGRRSRRGVSRAGRQPIAVVKAQIHAGGRGKGTIKTNPQQRGVQLVKLRPRRRPRSAGNLAGQDAGHDSNRARRARRPAGARRRRLRDRPRAVSGHRRRSRGGRAGADRLERRRHEDRRGRRQDARADFQRAVRSRRRACSRIRSASWPRKLGLKGDSVRSAEKFMQPLCRVFVAQRLQPGGNQSAGRHRSRASCWRSTPR